MNVREARVTARRVDRRVTAIRVAPCGVVFINGARWARQSEPEPVPVAAFAYSVVSFYIRPPLAASSFTGLTASAYNP